MGVEVVKAEETVLGINVGHGHPIVTNGDFVL